MAQVVADLIDERVKGKGSEDLIFPNAAGEPMQNTNARRDWFTPAVVEVFGASAPASGKQRRTQGAKPKVNVTPHDLRHTAASLAISAGANVKSVQAMLGHASATMTLDLYGHLFQDDMDAVAVALDRLPRAHILPT